MSRSFLSDAQPGQWLEEVFVITQKQLSTTQNGKPFIKCQIGDRSRTVPGRMWNANQGMFNAIPDGGFLRVAGRVENYQDNLQFIIDRFWILDDPSEVVLEELLPHSRRDLDEMFDRLRALLDSIRHRHLRAILEVYLSDDELMRQFRLAPAAMSFHHAFIGGLLEHTLGLCEIAAVVAPLYPLLNRDLLLAAAFLHDLAKTWELTYAAGFGYSDGGHLVGHVVKGAIWLDERSRIAADRLGEPIPPVLVDVLQHLILSHHGLPEHGAARLPSTPEAIALHLIDNLDAKLMLALCATREPSSSLEGNFTEFNRALGVRLFRPDVARTEAVEQNESSGPNELNDSNLSGNPNDPPDPGIEEDAMKTSQLADTQCVPDPVAAEVSHSESRETLGMEARDQPASQLAAGGTLSKFRPLVKAASGE
jgi:3'-5' exoribonuclease